MQQIGCTNPLWLDLIEGPLACEPNLENKHEKLEILDFI